MPELPEVELVRQQLDKFLVGHRITSITVNWRNSFKGDKNKIVGAKITKVERRGKVIIIKFDNKKVLLMHLKMTGQPIYRGPNLKGRLELSDKVKGGVPGKHTQVEFDLDKGGKFYFNDVRKFGWIKVSDGGDYQKDSSLKDLGKEPGRDLKLPDLKEIISKSKQKIKLLIMDQKKISGVGNIYANEALWLSQINPKTPANELSVSKVSKLYEAIHKVLKKGLSDGGASENSFVTPDGQEGRYQENPLVYNREGKSCKRCKTKIKKIKLGARGTYFCPTCQS